MDKRTAKIARYFPIVAGGYAGAPISIQVALTDKCFNRCIMCDHPDRTQYTIDVKDWLKFLGGMVANGVESVCYSGGDPFAYRDINEVMAYHVGLGLPFGFTCSGFVPPSIDMDLLKEAAWIRVSLDAVEEDVYKVVRGHTPLKKIIEGIDRMIAAGVNVELGVTIHKENESQWPLIQEFAKGRDIRIDMRSVYPMSSVQSAVPRFVSKFKHCSAVLYQLYIGSQGDVYPCCITNGDTKSHTFTEPFGYINGDWSETWKNVVAYSKLEYKDLPSICRSCCVQRLSEINEVCDGIETKKSFF